MPAGRKYPRARIPLLLVYWIDAEGNEVKKRSRLRDLAVGGARFLAHEEMPLNARVRMEMKNSENGEAIEVMGYVTRNVYLQNEKCYEVAARFVGLNKSQTVSIAQWVLAAERDERLKRMLKRG